MTARLLTTADEAEWRSALPADRSAFGCVEFMRVHERREGGKGRLLVIGDVAYPLLVREIEGLPFAKPGGGLLDAASPPYTGPLATGTPPPAAADEIAEALAKAGVVAEFAFPHPFDGRIDLVGGGDPEREIVWIDAALDPERLWQESYSHACRKNINRAEREGVTVREARSDADIAEFHRVYIATMERAGARESYMFPLEYFAAIRAGMAANARFALAEHEGRVIAGTLYLHDGADVYSYLGGADHEHQALRPTNAVVHATVAWARGLGKRRLILGGGYEPGDGIFRFKASFSPERARLRMVRRVHREQDYERLVAGWRGSGGQGDGGGFFPLYRAPVGA